MLALVFLGLNLKGCIQVDSAHGVLYEVEDLTLGWQRHPGHR